MLRERLPFDPLESILNFDLPDKCKNLNTNAMDQLDRVVVHGSPVAVTSLGFRDVPAR